MSDLDSTYEKAWMAFRIEQVRLLQRAIREVIEKETTAYFEFGERGKTARVLLRVDALHATDAYIKGSIFGACREGGTVNRTFASMVKELISDADCYDDRPAGDDHLLFWTKQFEKAAATLRSAVVRRRKDRVST